MLFHLCQPTKPITEELGRASEVGRAKLIGAVMYPRVDKVSKLSFFLSVFLIFSLSHAR